MQKKYKVNPNFLLREIAGEGILIPVGEANMFTNSVINMNETSQYLWKQFEEPQTVQEVIKKAKDAYNAPDGVIEKEVIEFMNSFLEVGLLEEEKL